MKKYELILNDSIEVLGCKLFRIRALINFDRVSAGDLGGYIQSEKNLSQDGTSWVADDAKVYDTAQVSGEAKVWGKAEIYANAKVSDNAEVCGNTCVIGNAKVNGSAKVNGNVVVWGEAEVFGNAKVTDNARVGGNAKVSGDAEVYGNAEVWGQVKIHGKAEVSGNADVYGNAELSERGDLTVFKNNWSSGSHFTYTKSNKMWKVGCFYGTGQELIEKAYRDSKTSGDHYKAYVDFVETLERLGE